MKLRFVAPVLLAIAVVAASADRSPSTPDRKSKPIDAPATTALAAPVGTGSPNVPVLSKKDRAAKIASLPDEEKQWLEEFVRPIIFPEEENLYLLLTQEHEREIFKEEFWKRREKPGLVYPLGPGYRSRYPELLRLADSTYDGRRQDAGRMVIAHGEPASIDQLLSCQDMFRDLQIWNYRGPSAGNRGEKSYFFYRRSPGAPRKLWDVSVPDSDVFQPGSCRKHFTELQVDCNPKLRATGDRCPLLTNCALVCGVLRVYEEIQGRQGSKAGGAEESETVLAPPSVELEGLEAIASRFPSIQDPRAKLMGAPATVTPSVAQATQTPLASLTPEEIRERILRLEPKYREFLDLAGPMFIGDELVRFLLMSDSSKDGFIREFWRRHK